jgi:hypothetical protein
MRILFLIFIHANRSFSDFGVTYNWVKQSIFWELSYWNTNVLRHNIYVMHIEKIKFENISNMVLDIKRKAKNNIKSRMDIDLFCDCQHIKLLNDEVYITKPKATYALD